VAENGTNIYLFVLVLGLWWIDYTSQWARLELTVLVVIVTDSKGSYKPQLAYDHDSYGPSIWARMFMIDIF
jgi:hypothetical protein